jgi:hypothetical protein
MLARQWQVGELRGEDAATPVLAKARVGSTRVSSLRLEPGGDTSAAATTVAATDHLEALTEAESPWIGPGRFRLSAETGLHLLRMLAAEGVGGYAPQLRAAWPLALPAEDPEVGAATRQVLTLLARRSIDGVAIHAALVAGGTLLPPASMPPTDATKMANAATKWRSWVDATFGAPTSTKTAWMPERMEYGLSVSARVPTGEKLLRAAEYPGGRLDWDCFDAETTAPHGLASRALTERTVGAFPTPARYAGMPSRRFWTFEDATVHFGGLEASSADLARLIVAQYATVAGDDWFVIPVKLDVGSLSRVLSLEVRDSWGQSVTLSSVAARDGSARVWRFFELTGDETPTAGQGPWLFVPGAATHALEGAPIEELHMVRDEEANLAWGIEKSVESPDGKSIDRAAVWRAATTTPERPSAGQWRYRLAPVTPSHWVPLLPERQTDGVSVRLRRGRVLQGVDAGGTSVTLGAKGRLLAPEQVLRLFEEEVPTGGLEVTRSWQLARSSKGRLLLWLGRRKRPGHTDAHSGLRYDAIEKG